jgi:radical SAM superfamily enzyme YgiQ (UPF0313 family)
MAIRIIMKIALINSPWWVRYCPPYIVASLSTFLKKYNYTTYCFDLNNILYHKVNEKYKKYWDDRDYYSYWENSSFVENILNEVEIQSYIDKILNTKSKIFIFTTHTTSVESSLIISKLIKQANKNNIIIFIGHKCSRAQMAYDFIRFSQVDYVCPGEVEISLLKLLEKLKQNNFSELPECKGFLLKKNNKIIDCGNPEIVENLDQLPFPDYDEFKKDIEENLYSQPNRLDILNSRGCINGCYFCYERLYWQKFRTMSGEKLFEQILSHITKFPKINYFYFNSLLLNADLDVLEKFCDLVIKEKITITWAGQAMVRKDMTRDILQKMAKSGCKWLGYGIESGSQKILNKMNKKFNIEDAYEVLKNTHEVGISVQINIMFGFPGETESDFQQTLDFVTKVRPYIDNILASQSFCTLEKETYMYKNPEQFGISPDSKHHLFWKSDNGKNNYLLRFKRYEKFCNYALSLGIPETSGVLKVKPDKWFLLGQYYYFEKQYKKALQCFEKSLKYESDNKNVRSLIQECHNQLKSL